MRKIRGVSPFGWTLAVRRASWKPGIRNGRGGTKRQLPVKHPGGVPSMMSGRLLVETREGLVDDVVAHLRVNGPS